MVMTLTLAKGQGQRAVGSKDRVEANNQTDGQTDGEDCITLRAIAVGNHTSVHPKCQKCKGIRPTGCQQFATWKDMHESTTV